MTWAASPSFTNLDRSWVCAACTFFLIMSLAHLFSDGRALCPQHWPGWQRHESLPLFSRTPPADCDFWLLARQECQVISQWLLIIYSLAFPPCFYCTIKYISCFFSIFSFELGFVVLVYFFVVSRLKTTAYLFRGIERAHVPLPVLILHLVWMHLMYIRVHDSLELIVWVPTWSRCWHLFSLVPLAFHMNEDSFAVSTWLHPSNQDGLCTFEVDGFFQQLSPLYRDCSFFREFIELGQRSAKRVL